VSEWVSADEQVPPAGLVVLCAVADIVVIGCLAERFQIEVSTECDIAEYDEKTDRHYLPPGWYERVSFWSDMDWLSIPAGAVKRWCRIPGWS
jgi:hypothetical protein